MIDTLLKRLPRLQLPAYWESLTLDPNNYFVVTLHRTTNVDEEHRLLPLLHAIAEGTLGLPVVFPVHPRTAKNQRGLGSKMPQLNYVDPLGYLEFKYLVNHRAGFFPPVLPIPSSKLGL